MTLRRKNNWTIIAIVSALLIMAWVIPVSAADAPTVTGAVTNTAGTTFIIEFNKTMADPSSKQAQFKYKIDGGANQPFSAAALNADTTKIDLTTSGTTIAHGLLRPRAVVARPRAVVVRPRALLARPVPSWSTPWWCRR